VLEGWSIGEGRGRGSTVKAEIGQLQWRSPTFLLARFPVQTIAIAVSTSLFDHFGTFGDVGGIIGMCKRFPPFHYSR